MWSGIMLERMVLIGNQQTISVGSRAIKYKRFSVILCKLHIFFLILFKKNQTSVEKWEIISAIVFSNRKSEISTFKNMVVLELLNTIFIFIAHAFNQISLISFVYFLFFLKVIREKSHKVRIKILSSIPYSKLSR